MSTRSATRAPARLLGVPVALALVALGVTASPAPAAPPGNDPQWTPGTFAPYSARNGTPRDLQAVAELAEATADIGATPCLGRGSFARTVWYSIPPGEVPQSITVEASGRTLDLVDVAAYVQPEGATGAVTAIPQACAGEGAAGANAAEEPTSAVSLDIPARRGVLIQVGRRGPVRSADDERVVLSLDARPLPVPPFAPAGDAATDSAPRARSTGPTYAALAGAVLTEEDPAVAPCPSLGSVWRRVVPSKRGMKLISAGGAGVSTLTVFSGARPATYNALDCVNRSAPGALQMVVPTRPRRTLWIRVGTDGPPDGSEAILLVEPGTGQKVVDGGRGGFDPTTGGPGGGLPPICDAADAGRARLTAAPFTGKAKQRNRSRSVRIPFSVRGGLLCDVELKLIGPRGHVYAETRATRLRPRSSIRLARIRALAKGSYRLRVTAISRLGDRVRVRTTMRGRLR